ncbi:MAG: DUF1576 domain-containing protein [Lachnospiraceae bacterium]|nr:DUF1576 domain-containing protein [Lachnospiraceae bacterium]
MHERFKVSRNIKKLCLFLTGSFFLASFAAAWYIDAWDQLLPGWFTIMTSPCPLVTDYFMLGNLASAFFNAGMCGLACCLLIIIPHSDCHASTIAEFFLVVAHCFYGLNFLNMWLPIFGIVLACKVMRMEFRSHVDMAMFSTAFGPFISEFLFRYPLGDQFVFGSVQITWIGVVLAVVFSVMIGFAIPAMLPGTLKMHRGFNLYNGGLAFGLMGLLIYSMMYRTMGLEPPAALPMTNEVYAAHGYSYLGFANIYFTLIFGICLVAGWWMNGKGFYGYNCLMQESGYRNNFIEEHGAPLVLLNLGIYGFMILAYMNVVILFTDGAGATGATVGVTLAAMTFVAIGQHPANVWPILLGYAVLSAFVTGVCHLTGMEVPWTLSTQGYINGVAFATGLCPIAGRYGWKIGMLAGLLCAIMCTSTSAIHGGFVLYNGGLTAGITTLIMVPLIEYYYHGKWKKDVMEH